MLGQKPVPPQLVPSQGFHDLQVMQLIPLLSKVHLQQLQDDVISKFVYGNDSSQSDATRSTPQQSAPAAVTG